ncbi:CinA family protein [Flavobacterium aquidurense]|jgi:nicotinamide-nucleotide amidase|uniref:CinA family protein n=1 Tax=Flavobacterium aquidurense TaxID=362413 RepID=UPI000920E20A|nr:CinA family protein [Flavobacterium aquidurense]OXA72921.1 damage-inducible protein CinA [Flavobacterium aquidurense]SHH13766.1 nicotinamide-nucleotide amidase [Flavobacterium frigidimaris]
MASEKVIACCQALIKKNWTITFVESASAGKLNYEFSTVFDSGKILIGGMVCYHASMKEDLLLIPHGAIKKNTAESPVVTRLMAQNFHRYVLSDLCVALTGLTTPGGSETPKKPVGTIFVHIIFPDKEIAGHFTFSGKPASIVDQAVDAVAEMILDEIQKSAL